MISHVFILELDHRNHFGCQILTEAHPCNLKSLPLRSLLTIFVNICKVTRYSAKEMYQLGKTKILSYNSCQYH